MSETSSFGDSQKCHLWLEEILQFDGLRKGAVCMSCSRMVGTHARRSNRRDSTNQSTKYSQTDFQAEEKSPEKKTNEQQIQSIITEDTSISPPDNLQSKNKTSSSSSHSMLSSINSDKSRDSPQALLRIHSAPTVPESEAAKQNIAILRGLKRRAMIEAAETRSKKIKHFLSKYCSSECVDPIDLYHSLLALLKNDHQRFYNLIQHARYNCLGLIQIANTTDQIIGIFKLINETIPLHY